MSFRFTSDVLWVIKIDVEIRPTNIIYIISGFSLRFMFAMSVLQLKFSVNTRT